MAGNQQHDESGDSKKTQDQKQDHGKQDQGMSQTPKQKPDDRRMPSGDDKHGDHGKQNQKS